MNKINYQLELDKIIKNIAAQRDFFDEGASGQKNNYTPPKLLMHSCCAPCSSYCMEYLREYFDITVFYYNPNISAEDEYRKRVAEEIRLIGEYNRQVEEYSRLGFECGRRSNKSIETAVGSESVELQISGMTVTPYTRRIEIIEGDYTPALFYETARGYENCPEGGERCFRCYEMRLKESFRIARQIDADYVTSTLTISPLKNAEKINEIGFGMASGTPAWLPSDFKKRNGYKRSIELSHEFGLYRQNFCGCVFSQRKNDA